MMIAKVILLEDMSTFEIFTFYGLITVLTPLIFPLL